MGSDAYEAGKEAGRAGDAAAYAAQEASRLVSLGCNDDYVDEWMEGYKDGENE